MGLCIWFTTTLKKASFLLLDELSLDLGYLEKLGDGAIHPNANQWVLCPFVAIVDLF
jgi:hypothetical protein